MCFRVKESVVTYGLWAQYAVCSYTDTCMALLSSRVAKAERPWSVVRARTNVCFRSTKSGVTVPDCGVCQWFLMTHTCALRMHVLRGLGACHLTHMRVAYAENHRRMCVAEAQGTCAWSCFRLPDCTCCFCGNVRVCDFAQMCVQTCVLRKAVLL